MHFWTPRVCTYGFSHLLYVFWSNMSRMQSLLHQLPFPCQQWFPWQGLHGSPPWSTRNTPSISVEVFNWGLGALLGGGVPIPSCNDYLSGRCMVSFQQPNTNRWGWRWYFSSPLIRALWEKRHKWRCFPSSPMRREVRQRNQFAFVSPGHSLCCDMRSPSHFYHSPFSCLFLLLFLLSLPPSGS